MTAAAPPRRDAASYALSALPKEVVALDRAVNGGLPVGAPGKVGVLELSLAPSCGITRVQRHYQRAPLHVYRPIYLDPKRPDMAFVFMQQLGDGFVQGDRCRVDVDCAPQSAVHITTQAATNVFAARENFATQLVNLRAGAGAVLEYLPDPVVPFAGSRLFQHVSVTADPTSTVILGETLLPGRVWRGEAHAYDFYRADTEVARPDGTLLFADTLRLNPANGVEPRSIGLLGPHDVVATLFVVTAEIDPVALVSLLRDALVGCPDVFAGVSQLPDGCGAVARLLGPSSKKVRATLRTLWNDARLAVLGVPAPDLRKG
jgi:urease accessory protein